VSILFTFRKLVDPNAASVEKEELRRHREDKPDDGAPDDDDKPALTLGRPEVHYQCRVCGHLGEDKFFCPTCLADTMLPLPAAR
jgi:rubrerythrin